MWSVQACSSIFICPFSVSFFPCEYEVLTSNVFSVRAYDDMPLTRLLSCLTTVSISFCLSLSFFRNWKKILFFLLVSFILHQEKEDEPMWQGAYMPSAFYWTFFETIELRCRVGLKAQIWGRIQTKFFCTESSMTTVAGKSLEQWGIFQNEKLKKFECYYSTAPTIPGIFQTKAFPQMYTALKKKSCYFVTMLLMFSQCDNMQFNTYWNWLSASLCYAVTKCHT